MVQTFYWKSVCMSWRPTQRSSGLRALDKEGGFNSQPPPTMHRVRDATQKATASIAVCVQIDAQLLTRDFG
jgi:hypothetical protein